MLQFHTLAEELQGFLVHIHGVDRAVGSDSSGQPRGEVTASGADVGDARAKEQGKLLNYLLRLLPLVALALFGKLLVEPRIRRAQQSGEIQKEDEKPRITRITLITH